MKYKHILIFLFLFVSVTFGYSQGLNCATAIIDAEDMYRAGKYDEAIQHLKTALKECSFSKREKEDAYIILTQAYLEKENYQEANHLLVKILNNDPNFKLKENLYQEDFYAYYKKVKIKPLFSAGVKLGLNFPKYSFKKVNSIYNLADYSSAYKRTTGYMYGIFAEWQFFDNISVLGEASFSKIGYKRSIEGSGAQGLVINYSEVMKSFEPAIYLKKYFLHKQYKPYIYAGGYLTYLNSAKSNIELSYNQKDTYTPDIDNYSLGKNNIDVLEMRNKKRGGVAGGLGMSYKTKNVIITADASYRMDIGKHLTNSVNKYKNEELLFKYYYIDNDVALSRVDVSLTVAYIFKYSVKSK